MEKTPFIFNYNLPVAGNSPNYRLPYISNGENDRNTLVTPEDADYRYESHHWKPKTSMNQRNYQYQWSGQNKIDELQNGAVSVAQVKGGSNTIKNPEWKKYQKIFLQNQPEVNDMSIRAKPYQYKKTQNIHGYHHQQLNAAGSDPYNSNTAKKVQQYDREKPLYQGQLPPQYVDESSIVKRSVHRVHTRIAYSVVDPFHLEPETSKPVLLSETATREGVSENIKHLPPVLQKEVTVNSSLNSTSAIPNNAGAVVNSMHADSTAYFPTLQGFGAGKYGSWASVFYTVVAISVFLETGSQSALVWVLRTCGVMTQDTGAVLHELATSSRVLIGWSLAVCPLVGVAAALSACPYQVTSHMVAAAALTFCALLLLPLVCPVSRSRKRKPSKPSYRKTYEDLHATLLKRFSFSLRMGITGFITACNLEFIMWYMEEQETFSHNYEFLYCGYSATASITQFLLDRLLRKRSIAAEDGESESEDETGGGSWRPGVGGGGCWWLWEAGALLLALEQLSAPLRPLWLLPPLLGALQGASSALCSGGGPSLSVSYRAGYGCGCLAAGLFVHQWGPAKLFQALSLGTSVCAAVAVIIRGVARCTANKRQPQAHLFSIASTESDASSDGEENEIAETDDWLVQALQQDEYQQAKKSHRIEC